MKAFLYLTLFALTASPAFAGEVAVSISLGQPGFYGRIDIGDFPQPRLIYAEPIVVERVVVVQQPIYLRVQPSHVKNWKSHCHQYQACGRPVYFVSDDWYDGVYVPAYKVKHAKHDKNKGSKNGNKKHKKHNKNAKHGK